MKVEYLHEHGYVSVCFPDPADGDPPDLYYVRNVHVDLSHRRQGIASGLLRQLCADADAAGVRLTLDASPVYELDGSRVPMDVLVALYERLGFAVVSRSEETAVMVRFPV